MALLAFLVIRGLYPSVVGTCEGARQGISFGCPDSAQNPSSYKARCYLPRRVLVREVLAGFICGDVGVFGLWKTMCRPRDVVFGEFLEGLKETLSRLPRVFQMYPRSRVCAGSICPGYFTTTGMRTSHDLCTSSSAILHKFTVYDRNSNAQTATRHRNKTGLTYSIVVPNTETANRGATRRCGLPRCEEGAHIAFNGAFTVYENFRSGSRTNPDRPCLGRREVDSAGNPTPYVFETYREIEERIDNFASGLEEEVLTPPNPDGMKLLALYSRNRPEWIIAEQAALCHSGVTVPLYDSLGPEAVEYVANQTGLTTVVCGGVQELRKLLEIAKRGSCATLKNVVVMDMISDGTRSEVVRAGLRVYAFADVEGIGAAHKHPHRPPAAKDVATFC